MTLARLIYASTSKPTTKSDEIQAILDTSRKFNAANGITGMLCFGNGRFVQYIEGKRKVLNELYNRIVQDTRHRDVMLLDYADITEPAFAEWSMGFISIDQEELLGYPVTQFKPDTLSARQAVELVVHLKLHLHPQVVVVPKGKRQN